LAKVVSYSQLMEANEAFGLGRIRERLLDIALAIDSLVMALELEEDPTERMMMGAILSRHVLSLAGYIQFLIETREDLIDPLRRDKIERMLAVLREERVDLPPEEGLSRQANALYALIRLIREVERNVRLEVLSRPLGELGEITPKELLELEDGTF